MKFGTKQFSNAVKNIRQYSEVIHINLERKDVKKEVLISDKFDVINVYAKWDSHGNLHSFPTSEFGNKDRAVFKNATCEITKITCKEYMDGDFMGNIEEWKLTINGKEISGDVYEYNYDNGIIDIDLILGWG